MGLDEFGKNYLTLGLRINKHIDGYVEHYYGPSEIKEAINLEGTTSPKQLLKDCASLLAQVKDQGYEEKRRIFFEKTLVAIQTILRKLAGEKILYLEQIEKLFDFKLKLYEDDFFFDLTAQAEEIYKGDGALSKRIQSYSQRRMISQKIIKSLMFKAIRIAKKKLKLLFPDLLPFTEKILLNEVNDKSWAMYNWYLGNYTSRIDINVDRLYYWTSLLFYACHEGYPGHHTESIVRDQLLFRKQGHFETSLLIIYSPEMVIHEGIGDIAEQILFSPSESNKISLEVFCPHPEIEDDIETLIKQNEIRSGFRELDCNLAYYKYVKGWTDDELIKYIRSFKVIPEIGIQAKLKFISDEIWAPYALVYQGKRLIIEKLGNNPTTNQFRNLIINQIIPSDLR